MKATQQTETNEWSKGGSKYNAANCIATVISNSMRHPDKFPADWVIGRVARHQSEAGIPDDVVSEIRRNLTIDTNYYFNHPLPNR